tara:strand:+ start:666 stop:830 length:165 start_codon:yes stop_codon:yes gene_type:complete
MINGYLKLLLANKIAGILDISKPTISSSNRLIVDDEMYLRLKKFKHRLKGFTKS